MRRATTTISKFLLKRSHTLSTNPTHDILCSPKGIHQHGESVIDPPTQFPRQANFILAFTTKLIGMQLLLSGQHPLPQIAGIQIVAVGRESREFERDVKGRGEGGVGWDGLGEVEKRVEGEVVRDFEEDGAVWARGDGEREGS